MVNDKLMADNSSYYSRVGRDKIKVVLDFVKGLDGVSSVLDVGCNNGDISFSLFRELGVSVRGIDLSENLNIPEGYDFVRDNIVTRGAVDVADVTLFLSVYHHVLSLYGLEVADRLFLRLLMRCNVLLFDCGNLSESRHSSFPWFKFQKGLFGSERELLEHFGLPFEIVGKWRTGGGVRSVVAFRRSDLVNSFVVVEEFRRLRIKAGKDAPRLIRSDDSELVSNPKVFNPGFFYKLRFNNFEFFAKFRNNEKDMQNAKSMQAEFDNLCEVYASFPSESLIPFYGWVDRFGFVFEWVNDLVLVKKPSKLKLPSGKTLGDSEVWSVNGVEKFIDFER